MKCWKIQCGFSDLIGWEGMLNKDDDIEIIKNEKILTGDDILKDDYSFKEQEEHDEAINCEKDSENF